MLEANPMSGVFRNIEPPTPLTARRGCTPLPLVRGEETLAGWRLRGGGGGVNSSEDARHCSVLYICKYFVIYWLTGCLERLSLRCSRRD
jgi:hypothetical protein